MAWTYWPLDYGTLPAEGLQKLAIYEELFTAYMQRSGTLGDPSFNPNFNWLNRFTNVTATGYAVAEAAFWAMFQNSVWSLFSPSGSNTFRFVNHVDVAGDWRGASGIYFWNWADGSANDITKAQYANVGGGGNTWTRRHGSNPDSLSTSYGAMQAGDVFGCYREGGVDKFSEFLNELYRVLDLCRYTTRKYTGFSSTVTGVVGNNKVQDFTTTISEATPALAYARLLTEWPGVLNSSITEECCHRCHLTDLFGSYRANGRNTSVKWQHTGSIPTFVQHSAKLYGYCEGFEEFDDDGLGYNADAMSLLESFSEAATSTRIGALLGNDTTVQDSPVGEVPPGGTIRRGYRVGAKWNADSVMRFVLNWTGPNGFTSVS